MPDMIERPDGTLVLETGADPAGAGHMMLGWKRFAVGLDVGSRGDPSALAIIKSESRPFMTGKGWLQSLTPVEYTCVWTEQARLEDATDVVDWTVSRLLKLKNWHFTFDASGLGSPLQSMFAAAKVPCLGVTITAGASFDHTGNTARVSKQLLFENAATLLETGQLRIAHDLQEKEQLFEEIQSVEYASTSTGQLTLKAGGRSHHADRFCALSLALIAETHLKPGRLEVRPIAGMF